MKAGDEGFEPQAGPRTVSGELRNGDEGFEPLAGPRTVSGELRNGDEGFGPPAGLRTVWCGELRAGDAGRRVRVAGWVARRREHSTHLAFVDVRDRSGMVQCVVDGGADLRPESVVAVEGTVTMRPEGTVNPNLATGEVELHDCSVEVLSESDPVPFSLEEWSEADEAIRLRYRFVDLRRERMQRNLRVRSAVNTALRQAMVAQGFTEVETPLLWTPTPEGAREFAVPSRLQKGSFYVLPQSPQIAKQLLMVAGVDRYFQIARCLRDEDLRSDRQFEFTQLDVEASFVGVEEVLCFVEKAVAAATEAATGSAPGPFRRITWREAMERFGSDKPDLRLPMELVDLHDIFESTEFRAFRSPSVRALRVPGGGSFTRSRLDSLIERAKVLGAQGLVWMRVADDLESPVAKFLSEEERASVKKRCAAEPGDLVLVVAGEEQGTSQVLGQLRRELGEPNEAAGDLAFVWVTEFPLFDGVDEAGNPQAAHHPFTMPHPDDLDLLESDPLRVRSLSYDLVLNGWELGSGSIRIHRADVQEQVFRALGISPEEATERFGFLTGAFRYGAPPHGGFAVGIDRLVALLCGEENIREVIAFPKTQSGSDPMTGAPKPLGERQLAELGLRPRAGA
jgi:aspartyl-tRNA synthetase